MTPEQRLENLDRHIANNTIIRKGWGDGYERACLLVALAPEVAQCKSVAACPADVMPEWLAHLTTCMDDGGTVGAWPAMVARYAETARRWHVLSHDAWERCRRTIMIAFLQEIRPYVTNTRARDAVDDAVLWVRLGEPRDQKVAELLPLRLSSIVVSAVDTVASVMPQRVALLGMWVATASNLECYCNAHEKTWDRMTTSVLDALEAEINAAVC